MILVTPEEINLISYRRRAVLSLWVNLQLQGRIGLYNLRSVFKLFFFSDVLGTYLKSDLADIIVARNFHCSITELFLCSAFQAAVNEHELYAVDTFVS